MKDLIKSVLYRGGALAVAHRLVNRNTLTVAMFHRVLTPDDPDWRTANPTYAVSDQFFDRCLDFFKRHYTVIDLAALRTARDRGRRLPPRSLLITFDDGWADNLAVAAPILQHHRLPAVIFVAVSPLLEDGDLWWQDIVDFVIAHPQVAETCGQPFQALFGSDRDRTIGSDPAGRHYAVLAALAAMPAAERQQLLAPITARCGFSQRPQGHRQMMRPEQLAALSACNIEIGAHGFSHLPLTGLRDPVRDLYQAYDWFRRSGYGGDQLALSFPHGRYTDAILRDAVEIGFDLIFTSDPSLNRTDRPWSARFGRVGISSFDPITGLGDFSPPRMATELFHRPAT